MCIANTYTAWHPLQEGGGQDLPADPSAGGYALGSTHTTASSIRSLARAQTEAVGVDTSHES